MSSTYDRKSKLPPPSAHRVSLKQASKLTRNYRQSIPAADKTGFFHKQAIIDLMKQPGVVGMRNYHGLDDKGCYHLVLVGVDRDGRDLVESKGRGSRIASTTTAASSAANVMTTAAVTGGSAVILDTHYPCPPWCPPPGPLNA